MREGVDEARIHFVGNVMIDSLNFYRVEAENRGSWRPRSEKQRYGLVTLHRPSNVDDAAVLIAL
jgi:UDP-N-acetylglucosamine 2-epimerase (non-hydrolysing)